MSRALVIGGGIAALAAAVELAERGIDVDVVADRGLTRMPGAPEGGINGGDDVDGLIADTIACSGGLADRAAVEAMARAAADIVAMLARRGVPFARDDDGFTRRRLEGARAERALFVSSSTAQQIARVLHLALMRAESEAKARIRRIEHRAIVSLVVDDGRVVGAISRDAVGGDVAVHRASAVLLATPAPRSPLGDPLLLPALRAGASLRFFPPRLHPGLLARSGRRALVSSALRAEGARFWLPDDDQEPRPPRDIPRRERDHFIEAAFPEHDNLAADDVVARAMWQRCVDEGRGVYDRKRHENKASCYLDLTHLPEAHLRARVGRELDACAALLPLDPYRHPLEVEATVAGALTGLWIDRAHRADVPGLYAAGGAAALYHGTCPLGGNVLLADIHGAQIAARTIADEIADPITGETTDDVTDPEAPKDVGAPMRAWEPHDEMEALVFDGDPEPMQKAMRERDDDCTLAQLAIEAMARAGARARWLDGALVVDAVGPQSVDPHSVDSQNEEVP